MSYSDACVNVVSVMLCLETSSQYLLVWNWYGGTVLPTAIGSLPKVSTIFGCGYLTVYVRGVRVRFGKGYLIEKL